MIENESQGKTVITDAWLAGMPYLLIGASISSTWLIIGKSWRAASSLQIQIALIIGILFAGVVAVGGIYAIVRHFPNWGFTWIGADIIGFLLVAKGLAEERSYFISKIGDWVLLGIVVIFSAFVLLIAARRNWQTAGLVGIGFSTTLALSNVHLMAIPPYNRTDLAILGISFGLISFLLTFFYFRSSNTAQMAILSVIGLMNFGIIWLANDVWSPRFAELGQESPFIPMTVIMLILLGSGPVAGIFYNQIAFRFEKRSKKIIE